MINFGNYNIYSLADAFVGGLRTSIEQATSPPYVPVINYVYDDVNNRLTFYLSGTGTTIEILDTEYQGLNRALGFGGAWTMTASSLLIGVSSNRDCDVSPSRCLYVTSTTLQQAQNFSAIDSQVQLANMLTMIPLDRTPLLFVQHKPSYVVKTTLNNAIITELQFTLRDNLLPEVYEMELDWQLHLVIEEVRVEPYMNELYRQLGEFFTPQLSSEELLRKQQTADAEFRAEQAQQLAELRAKLAGNVEKLTQRYEKNREKRKNVEKKNKISRKSKDNKDATDDQKTSN